MPLSSGQRRLWFLEQLEADAGAAYQMTARFRIEPAVDHGRAGEGGRNGRGAARSAARAPIADDEGEPVFHVARRIAAGDVLARAASPRADAPGARIRLSAYPLWRIDSGRRTGELPSLW